ncbi:MAG: ABC transporter permease [Halobacteria archaeon]
MNLGRVRGEAMAEWRSFLRKPAAVFFTFVFPAILVALFAVVVGAGGGFFEEPQGYYFAGYLGFVVLLTPLSRLSSTVARGRDNRRFEKLATTPLTRVEWLTAHVAVNAVLIVAASVLIAVLLLVVGGASLSVTPVSVVITVAAVLVASTGFCGLGALIGRAVSSQDGAIAVSNGVGFPMLFLADTFVAPDALGAGTPVVELLPLTYFSRSVRGATFPDTAGTEPAVSFVILVVFSTVLFAAGAYALPWKE